jgi:Tfp pilus assembly protein PilF
MLLGQAYLAYGSPEMVSEAKAELQQALALDATLIWARFDLAKIYMDLGRLQPAERELEQADRLKPGVPHVLSLRGEIRRRSGDPQKALELNRSALAADREFSPARYYAGLALLDLRREDDALKELEAAAASRYVIPEMLTALASQYIQRGNFTHARNVLDRALALDPSRPETHLHLARLARVRRDFSRAHAELKIALPQRGRVLNTVYAQQLEADVVFETGRVFEDTGDMRGAREAYQRALNVLPDHEAARERLSRLR